MRLVDLHPSWFGGAGRERVGIMFRSPAGCIDGCSDEWHHCQVAVQFANPVDGLGPLEPDRPAWVRDGDTFETLTLSPSIRCQGAITWHGFVTDGKVRTV